MRLDHFWNHRSAWNHDFRVDRRYPHAPENEEISGKKATDLDLVSLKTWMHVDETEQKNKESQPIHPR